MSQSLEVQIKQTIDEIEFWREFGGRQAMGLGTATAVRIQQVRELAEQRLQYLQQLRLHTPRN